MALGWTALVASHSPWSDPKLSCRSPPLQLPGRSTPSLATPARSPRGGREHAQAREGGGQAGVAPSPQPSWPHQNLTPDQPPPPRPPADPQAGRGSKSTGGCPQGQGRAVRKQQSQRLQTVHSGRSAPADGDPPRQEASSGVTAASPPHCTCGVRTPGGSGRTWPSACGPLHPGHGQGFPRVQDGQGWGWWEAHRSAQPAGGPHIC